MITTHQQPLLDLTGESPGFPEAVSTCRWGLGKEERSKGQAKAVREMPEQD